VSFLRAVWKDHVRKSLRKSGVKGFYLGWDPLDFLAYEWTLQENLEYLARALIMGTYRAAVPEILRGAKSLGMTRPLAFFRPDDQIVFSALTNMVRADLREGLSRPWTSSGRDSALTAADADFYSIGRWFEEWSARQHLLEAISNQFPLVLVTDIANFYPSVRISDVVTDVLDRTELDPNLARLLQQFLEDAFHSPDYHRTAARGLPQDSLDCSRELANAYLAPLDHLFEQLGQSQGYTRWVDDIVIGVSSRGDGLRKMRELQLQAEHLSLSLNTSKTKLILASELREGLCLETNHLLDDLTRWIDISDRGIRMRGEWQTPHLPEARVDALHEAVRAHVGADPTQRSWESILRRLYRLCRWTRDELLIDHALGHLRQYPGSAAHILSYLSVFPLPESSIDPLFDAMESVAGVYDDILARGLYFVATAPNGDEVPLRRVLAARALELLRRLTTVSARLSAHCIVVVGKFGYPQDYEEISRLYRSRSEATIDTRQALILLFGAAPRGEGWSGRIRRTEDWGYLAEVLRGNTAASQLALARMGPVEIPEPRRHIFRPHVSLLGPLIRESDPNGYRSKSRTWTATVRLALPELRDKAAFRLLHVED
jgi:hypothetical protein